MSNEAPTAQAAWVCAACLQAVEAEPCPHCGAPTRLAGTWRLLGVLGRGGAGMTWRAEGPDGVVAVKEIPLRGLDRKGRELVGREADVLARLAHPAVPRLIARHEVGRGRDRALFLVQELVPGETLEEEAAHHRYTEPEVCRIIAELAEVLADLHARQPPLIHRDIKPANVIRRPDGTLALVDFGAVRDAVRDPDLGGSTVAGTFGYMAPEQFRGDASPATDLFGLGALAVRLLTRTEPHRLQDVDQRMRWRRAVQVDPRLGALLDGLLEPREDLRRQEARTVAQQAADLARVIERGVPPERHAAPGPVVQEARAHGQAVRELVGQVKAVGVRGVDVDEQALRALLDGEPAAPLEPRRSAGPVRRGVIGGGVGALILAVVGVGLWLQTTPDGSRVSAEVAGQVGAGPMQRRAASRWARDVAASLGASGACGAPAPAVVVLDLDGSGRVQSPAGEGAAACWQAQAAARGLRPPAVGPRFWLVPGAADHGPDGLALPDGSGWLDPLTGARTPRRTP